MAEYVDELMLSIGIDAEKVKAAFAKLQSDMAQVGKQASNAAQPIAKQLSNVGREASSAGAALNELGGRWKGMFTSLITRYAMPLAGALSIGGLITRHMSAVGQVAQMTGAYFTQLEEYRKKRAMLQRINKEDIELYRKGRLAMMNFGLAVDSLSTTFMRALSPVIRVAIEWLNKFSDWIQRNEPNIIRFFTVLAAVITAVLIPAFLKLAVAMLTNPFTWLVAAIMAVVVVIDDLIVYMRGGKSALEDFWKIFGTGEEISQALGETWEWLKATGLALWEGLKTAVGDFFDRWGGYIEGVKVAFTGLFNFVKALFKGDWVGAGEALYAIGEGYIKAMKGLFSALWSYITDYGKRVKNFFVSLPEKLPGFIKKLMGISSDLKKGFERAENADIERKTATGGQAPQQEGGQLSLQGRQAVELAEILTPAGITRAGGMIPSHAQAQAATAPRTENHTKNTKIDSQITVNQTINAQNADAQGLMTDAAGAARTAFGGIDPYAANTGVAQ